MVVGSGFGGVYRVVILVGSIFWFVVIGIGGEYVRGGQ